MNTYLKFIVVSSVVVAVVAVVMRDLLPEYLKKVKGSPTLQVVSRALQDILPLNSFLLSLCSVFPSLHSLFPSLHHPAKTTTPVKTKKNKERLFTPEELKKYDGKDGNKGPYLAILGRVYNVKKGNQHYGPGGGYEFFAGRDASRAFVSGDFSENGLIDDISGLSGIDYIGLDEWVKFYESDYKYVGKLIGRYYDKSGVPTSYYTDTQRWISEAYSQKESDAEEKKRFPPCNSEWKPESGSRLWCTKKSGGIERDWVGVPRKLFTPGHSKPRCACVKGFGSPSHDPKKVNHRNRGDLDHPHLEEYPNCKPDQPVCIVKDV